MEIPEKVRAFTPSELDSLVEKMDAQGIVGEWEKPLSTHFMDVKVWGYDCVEYIEKLVNHELCLTENTAGTDRILYDPERYTGKQAVKYGDSTE